MNFIVSISIHLLQNLFGCYYVETSRCEQSGYCTSWFLQLMRATDWYFMSIQREYIMKPSRCKNLLNTPQTYFLRPNILIRIHSSSSSYCVDWIRRIPSFYLHILITSKTWRQIRGIYIPSYIKENVIWWSSSVSYNILSFPYVFSTLQIQKIFIYFY